MKLNFSSVTMAINVESLCHIMRPEAWFNRNGFPNPQKVFRNEVGFLFLVSKCLRLEVVKKALSSVPIICMTWLTDLTFPETFGGVVSVGHH